MLDRRSASACVDARCRVPRTAAAPRVRFETLGPDGAWRADPTSGAGQSFSSLGALGVRRRVVATWREPGRGAVFVTRAFESPAVAPSPRIVDLGELVSDAPGAHQVRAVPQGSRVPDPERARVVQRASVELELEGPLEAPVHERARYRVALAQAPLDRWTGLERGSYRVRVLRARAHDVDAGRFVVAEPAAPLRPAGMDTLTTDALTAGTVDIDGRVVEIELAVLPGARVELVGASSSARLVDVDATAVPGSVARGATRSSPGASGPDLDGTVHVDLPEGEWIVECRFDSPERSGAPRRARAQVLVQAGRRERAAFEWVEERRPRALFPSRSATVGTAAAFLLGALLALLLGGALFGERARVLVPISVSLAPGVASDDAPQWLRVLAIDRVAGQVRVLHDDRTGGTLRRDVELPVGTWELVAFAGHAEPQPSVRQASRRTFIAASRFHVAVGDGGPQQLELVPAALAVIDRARPLGVDGWPDGVVDLWPRARVADEAVHVQPLVPNVTHESADGASRVQAGPPGSVVLASRRP